MLRPFRASKDEREKLLAAAADAPLSSPHLLTMTTGRLGELPSGFAHDYLRSEIGSGPLAFARSCEAFRNWEQFDLGWVRVVNPTAGIAAGELVAVEAHTAWLWSMNLSRITEMVNEPARFGFLYTTTAFHIEEGQERFLIEIDPASNSVSYLTEAVSRPRHILARIGYPFSRAMQHRFARDSHARMRLAAENQS